MNRWGKKIIVVAVVLLGLFLAREAIWKWGYSYRWCPIGKSMIVIHNTGKPVQDQYAKAGEKGVYEDMRGPGRHFFDSWNYGVDFVDDLYVPPGKMLVVTNLFGERTNEPIAEPHQKGVQRQVWTAGTWRYNKYGIGFETEPGPRGPQPKLINVQEVPPGYVGVQIYQTGPNKGYQTEVLPSGLYPLNPNLIKINAIEVGYRVWDMHTDIELVTVEDKGVRKKIERPKPGTGVWFRLKDGKWMVLDMTVVWGIWPEDAPIVDRDYGGEDGAEQKVVIPQIMSICENAGSNLTTQQFIEGKSREKFQDELTIALQNMAKEKHLKVLIALVRGFHPDEQIKQTIQNARIAEEEKITLGFEQVRDAKAAELEEAKQMVDIRIRDFQAESQKMIEAERETGGKKAAEISARADLTVADLKQQIAMIDADITRIKGQAEADVIEADKKADAALYEYEVAAYGGADNYTRIKFVENLDADALSINFLPVGEGTMWTNADDLLEAAARKTLSQQSPTTRKAK